VEIAADPFTACFSFGIAFLFVGPFSEERPRHLSEVSDLQLARRVHGWLAGDYTVWPALKRDEAIPKRDGLFVITNYEKIYGGREMMTFPR
jgi:hypothetical protein